MTAGVPRHPTPKPKANAMKRSDAFPSSYLNSADVKAGGPDEKLIVTIEYIELQQMPDRDGTPGKKKPVAFLTSYKPWVIIQENWDALEEKLGDDSDRWTGARVRLCVRKVRFGGKMVDGIRVDGIGKPPGANSAQAVRPASYQAPLQPVARSVSELEPPPVTSTAEFGGSLDEEIPF